MFGTGLKIILSSNSGGFSGYRNSKTNTLNSPLRTQYPPSKAQKVEISECGCGCGCGCSGNHHPLNFAKNPKYPKPPKPSNPQTPDPKNPNPKIPNPDTQAPNTENPSRSLKKKPRLRSRMFPHGLIIYRSPPSDRFKYMGIAANLATLGSAGGLLYDYWKNREKDEARRQYKDMMRKERDIEIKKINFQMELILKFIVNRYTDCEKRYNRLLSWIEAAGAGVAIEGGQADLEGVKGGMNEVEGDVAVGKGDLEGGEVAADLDGVADVEGGGP